MYLEAARNLADVLLVGINTDDSVRRLKGPGRPINFELERAAVVAALQSVDAVCLFGEPTAHWFLSEAEPDVWVKGGDYTRGSLDQDECRVVEQAGGMILILPFIPGKSTTVLLRKISCRENRSQPEERTSF